MILAVGTLAQASYSVLFFAPGVIAPALRQRFGLDLSEIGIVLACSSFGAVLTLLPWGLLADRVGERVVIAVGLGGAAAALALTAFVADGFWSLSALLVLAGMSGASVNAASGRAVMHWFGADERGGALGIRQTAIPIGGFAAALGLPHLSVRGAFLVLALGCAVTALGAALFVREGPRPAPALTPERALAPLRDAPMWFLCGGSALLLTTQVCFVGFAVLFLHDARGLSPARAAAVVAVVQILGGVGRIAAGRWSDRLGSRLTPLRRLAVGLVVACALTAAVVSTPRGLLLPVLVVTGGLAMSWNGLSFTAAAEAAGHARSGAALGFQQTVLSIWGSIAAPAFAALVAATSWRAGFATVALAPLAAWAVLGRIAEVRSG